MAQDERRTNRGPFLLPAGQRRMVQTAFTLSVLLLGATLLPSAIAWGQTRSGTGRPLVRLDFLMPWVPPSEYGYWVMAQEKGFYRAEGLEVTLHEGSGSGNTVRLVGAGTMPMGLADANRILSGRVQGVPVTSVMTLFYTSPVLVVSLPERGITKLEHLLGKKLGSAPDSAHLLMWRSAMTRAGLDYRRVEVVALDAKATAAALLGRQVDAIFDQTLNADLEVDGIYLNRFPLGLDVVADSVVVNDRFLQQQPETVRAFVRASLRGVDYVKQNPAETVEVMARRFPTIDRRKLEKRQKLEASWVWPASAPPDRFGWQRRESWKDLQDILFETKQIDRMIEIESFVSNDYLPYR